MQEIEQGSGDGIPATARRRGAHADPELATVLLRTRPRSHESYGELVWRKFRRSKVAIIGGLVVVGLYLGDLFQFFSPYDPVKLNMRDAFMPPTQIHFIDSAGQFHCSPLSTNASRYSTPI